MHYPRCMGKRVFLLPPGAEGERQRFLKDAVSGIGGPDYSGVCYVAPTEAFLSNARGVFHDSMGPCYMPPRMQTLRQFSRALMRRHSGKTIIPASLSPVIISKIGKISPGLARKISEFTSELKQAFPLMEDVHLEGTLRDAFGELGIPEEVSQRAFSALEISLAYNRTLEGAGLMDEDDALALSASKASGLGPIRRLIIDGYYEMSRAELLLAAALISVADETLITVPISDPCDDLLHCYLNDMDPSLGLKAETVRVEGKPARGLYEYHCAPSREGEVEEIARRIKGAFISGRERDLDSVHLVFPSLEGQREMITRVLSRYGIPHVITPARPLSRSRAYMDLIALIESVYEDYPRLLFSRALSSPYMKNVPEAIRNCVPKICLNAGVVKGRHAWQRAFSEHKAQTEAARLFKALAPLRDLVTEGTFKEYAEAVLAVSRKLGFEPPAAEDTNGGGLEELLGGLFLLDEIPGGKPGPREFIDAFKSILEGKEEDRGDATPGGVRVSELFKVRGLEPGSLYLGGLRDGDIPYRRDMDFLLPDSVRVRLGLLDLRRHLSLQEKIFRRITASAGDLYASYASSDRGDFSLPSNFISGWELKEERSFGVFSKEEEMLRRIHKGPVRLTAEAGGIRAFSQKKAINVTSVDSYRRCPRRFFIEKVLRLEPPEMAEFELDPMEAGSIVHAVMERLSRHDARTMETYSQQAAQALDEVLSDSSIEHFFKRLLRESFMLMLPGLFEIEEGLRSEGYGFHTAEMEVEGEPIPGIRLKGKVDRVDALAPGSPEPGIEIIDYKTGSKHISGAGVLRGTEDLQLFLYAAMLRELGMNPIRAGIYSLRDIRIKWIPQKTDPKKGITMDDYIESSLGHLEQTARGMNGGDFTARPLSEQTCRNCHERPYCPYIQGEGERKGQGHGGGDA